MERYSLSAANASQSITTGSNGTVNVANFNLLQGQWYQFGTLPTFTASTSFTLANSGVQFLRATAGNGTSTPYTIVDIYGLQGIGSSSTLLSDNYQINSDINATNGTNVATWNSNAGFVPIGTSGTPFTGSFEGNAYLVQNLTVNLPSGSNVGLFGETGSAATIDQVGVTNAAITGQTNVGTLVGNNAGTITESFSTGSVTSTSGSNVGGLIGENTGSITNAYTWANVAGGSSSAVGGFVGLNTGSSADISDVYSIGSVTGGSNVGGLAGVNSTSAQISASFWNTDTSGKATGVASNTATVSNVTGGCASGTCTNGGTADMQSLSTYTSTPYNWSNAIWGIDSPPAYPTLLSFDSHANRTITGIAYSDQGLTPVGAGDQIEIIDNGTLLSGDSVTTSTGGVFEFTFAAGAIADTSDLLVYLNTGGTHGSTFAIAPTGGLDLTNVNIYANDVMVTSSATIAANSALGTALGGQSIANALYTNTGANLTLANNVSLVTTSATTYTVDGTISGGTGSSVNFGGAVNLNNSITTGGAQTYSGAVTMAGIDPTPPLGSGVTF